MEKDPERTIQRSLLSQQGSGYQKIEGVDVKYITSRHEAVTKQVRHDRIKVDGPDQDDGKTKKIKES